MSLAVFDFHGDRLQVVSAQDTHWVVVRRVCESLGIDADSQRKRLQDRDRSPWAVTAMTTATGPDGKSYSVFCIDLDSLPMWLANIDSTRVRGEVKSKLVTYQKECARVLRDHLFGPRQIQNTPETMRALGDPAFLRNLLGDYAERVLALQGEIAEARPKVEVYDRIVDSGDTVGFREACKLIRAGCGAKETEVRAFMVFARWIQRLGGRLAPASYGQDQGYVTSRDREIVAPDGSQMVVPELRITQRGVARAIVRLKKGDAA